MKAGVFVFLVLGILARSVACSITGTRRAGGESWTANCIDTCDAHASRLSPI